MDKDLVRAYLWQEIIRLGFCPVSTKDQTKWLHQYCRSLKDFWEVTSYPRVPDYDKNKNNYKVRIDCISAFEVEMDCIIESRTKFVVTILYKTIGSFYDKMWAHDVDGSFYTFPFQIVLNKLGRRVTAIRKFSEEDVRDVLDGLIFHPAAHQHIEVSGHHEIRFGGGIDNPFLYLFHLRYQLCPYEEKRKAEKIRLIELFSNVIRNKETTVLPVADLLAQPAR